MGQSRNPFGSASASGAVDVAPSCDADEKWRGLGRRCGWRESEGRK